MQIAIAQINSTLGDFSHNREKIIHFSERAAKAGADLVVFPEHALVGYLPNDLLEREAIVAEQTLELKALEKQCPKGIALLVGCVTPVQSKKAMRLGAKSLAVKRWHNSVALIERGKKTKFFHKSRLPSYDVFDEARHLAPGSLEKARVRFRGKNLLITICEDIWGWTDSENPLLKIKRTGLDLVINCSASPFSKTKHERRRKVVAATAKHFRAPMIYVNMVGSQDEVAFDGRSMVVNQKGKFLAELGSFKEELAVFSLVEMRTSKANLPERPAEIELVRRALVQGIRDFVLKNQMSHVHLGLSGGVDSAVVACLAAEALGPENVEAITLPGPFNDPNSREWAERLAKSLGIACRNISIEPSYNALKSTIDKSLDVHEFGVVHENLQARLRGTILMAYSNVKNSLLLSTGNKSEYAAGYTTLYGDQCGGLAVIGDLLKREVYELACLYNEKFEIIPNEIIDRPPSAELRPNQRDQDSLPPYTILDKAVEKLVERREAARTEEEKWLLSAIHRTEFKRWQAPPILKVSDHAFGRGRRVPIVNRAHR